MQIHRFRGRTLFDALLRAREEHGEGAVVVGHEASPDGGVTVAVAGAELAGVRGHKRRQQAQPKVQPARPRALEAQAAVRKGASGRVVPRPASSQAVRQAPAPSAVARTKPLRDPGLREVGRRLERSGASRSLIEQTLRAVAQSGARGTHTIDVAARFLGTRFGVAKSPKAGRATQIIAFVGPTGVGKTTTISKLAGRLARAGRKVAVATTDVDHPAGTAALHRHATELGVPVNEARNAKELLATVARHRDAEVLLLDTAGRSPLDAASVRGLSRVLERTSNAVSLTSYLVLPATSQKEVLEEALRGFAECEPSACVVTKVDETQRIAGVLEFTAFHNLDVAFLCDGADPSEHLHRPKPEHFADLLLRGRLA